MKKVLVIFVILMIIPMVLASNIAVENFIKKGDKFLKLAGSRLKPKDYYSEKKWKERIGEKDFIAAFIAKVYYERARLEMEKQ